MIVTALGWRIKYLNTMTVMITIYKITITMTLDAPVKFRFHITMTNNDKAKQPRTASTQHTAPSSAATEATLTTTLLTSADSLSWPSAAQAPPSSRSARVSGLHS